MSEEKNVELTEQEILEARSASMMLAACAAPYNANGLSLQKSLERAERILEASEAYVVAGFTAIKKRNIEEEEKPSAEGQADGDPGE